MLDTFHILASATAEQSGVVSDMVNNFGINWKILLVQGLNFAVLMALLYKFAFKPVLSTIEERQNKISSGLKYAEKMEKKLDEAELKQTEMLHEASLRSQEIIQEARDQAKALLDKETQAATTKVEQMLEKGRLATEQERQKILDEARQEIARLVVMTSSKVLSTELSDAQKTAFNEAAAKELSSVN